MSTTPGPWQQYAPAIACEKNSPLRVIDENYRYIRAGRYVRGESSNQLGGFSLSGFISPDDASLISAAPDLLTALERMVAVANWSDTIQSEEEFDAMIANAEAAIRKAKGESA